MNLRHREASDGELLNLFVQSRDELVFAELVRRHGALVSSVCLRITGDSHLAEDAFQAVWLVLVKKGSAVRPTMSLRGWLYGVAVNVAQRARTMQARHSRREYQTETLHEVPAANSDQGDPDSLRILDEEIAALPDRLRNAVILCELEGKSRREAARELGIPEGTLSSRLAKARKVLTSRLKSRGITGVSLAGLSGCVMPAAWAESSRQAVLGMVSPAVHDLARSCLGSLLFKKLTGALILGVSLIAAMAGIAGPSSQTPIINNKPDANAIKNEPLGGTIAAIRGNRVWLVNPATQEERWIDLPGDLKLFSSRFSPNGRWLAVTAGKKDTRPPTQDRIVIHDMNQQGPNQVVSLAEEFRIMDHSVLWMSDSTQIGFEKVPRMPNAHREDGYCAYELNTKITRPITLREYAAVRDRSLNGDANVRFEQYHFEKRPVLQLVASYKNQQSTITLKTMTILPEVVFSKSGRSMLYTDLLKEPDIKRSGRFDSRPEFEEHLQGNFKLFCYRLDKKVLLLNQAIPPKMRINSYVFSPDETRIAVSYSTPNRVISRGIVVRTPIEYESVLAVMRPDGTDASILCREVGSSPTFPTIDWRDDN